MDFDGFLYVFAVIGIAITAAAASLGVALVVTMARLSYTRFKLVAPLLFSPIDVAGQRISQQPVTAPLAEESALEAMSKYLEKTRVQAAANGGRKSHVTTPEVDMAAGQ